MAAAPSRSHEEAEQAIGTTIGQYLITGVIGCGGMGSVFLGEHTLIGRRAAIKTLLPSLSKNKDIVERFFHEARITSSISDPGVVQVFDFGYHDNGTAYIVMEFLEGEPLDSRIDRHGKMPIVDALRIARQLAGSLGALHAAGIIHRDLKPENVFVVHDAEAQGGERPKILDFGVAKQAEGPSRSCTLSGVVLGTPVYMSPEQCRGAGQVDHRSDIYALGCMLFHMLTGRPPFQGDSIGELLAAHLREEPPWPSEYASPMPAAVDAVVLRCIAKAPEARFASMAELQIALETVLTRLTDKHAAAAPPAPAPRYMLPSGFRSDHGYGGLAGEYAAFDLDAELDRDPDALLGLSLGGSGDLAVTRRGILRAGATTGLVPPRRRLGLWAAAFFTIGGSAAYFLAPWFAGYLDNASAGERAAEATPMVVSDLSDTPDAVLSASAEVGDADDAEFPDLLDAPDADEAATTASAEAAAATTTTAPPAARKQAKHPTAARRQRTHSTPPITNRYVEPVNVPPRPAPRPAPGPTPRLTQDLYDTR